MRTCAVSEFKCLAPAGWGISGVGFAEGSDSIPTRTKCYVCDESVCTECSRMVTWYGKAVRACTNCVSEEVDDFYGDLARRSVLV